MNEHDEPMHNTPAMVARLERRLAQAHEMNSMYRQTVCEKNERIVELENERNLLLDNQDKDQAEADALHLSIAALEIECRQWQEEAGDWYVLNEGLEDFYEKIERERDALRVKLEAAQEALRSAVDFGSHDWMHNPGCPEDDTCDCRIAAMVNAALAEDKS